MQCPSVLPCPEQLLCGSGPQHTGASGCSSHRVIWCLDSGSNTSFSGVPICCGASASAPAGDCSALLPSKKPKYSECLCFLLGPWFKGLSPGFAKGLTSTLALERHLQETIQIRVQADVWHSPSLLSFPPSTSPSFIVEVEESTKVDWGSS